MGLTKFLNCHFQRYEIILILNLSQNKVMSAPGRLILLYVSCFIFFLQPFHSLSQYAIIKGQTATTTDSIQGLLKINPVVYQAERFLIKPLNGEFTYRVEVKEPVFLY